MDEEWYQQISDLFACKEGFLTNTTLDGHSPVMALARFWLIKDVDQDRLLSFTKTLLERKDVNVNKIDKLCWTALAYAARYHGNDVRFIQVLLSHPDINVNCRDVSWWTPLMNACRNVVNGESSLVIVKTLLGHAKIDPNIHNLHGDSALSLSARYGDYKTYKEVLYHCKTQFKENALYSGSTVEYLLTDCRKAKDYPKKLLCATMCPKVKFDNLWVFACKSLLSPSVRKTAFQTLCIGLKHNRIKKLAIPTIPHQTYPSSRVINNILKEVKQCSSLERVHIVDNSIPGKSGRKILEAIYANLSITYITTNSLSKLSMDEEIFLLHNRRAFHKCYKATIIVLMAFKKLLNKDVARMIAKLVWASAGTRVWHEKGYITLGEKRRVERLCLELSTQINWAD